MTRPEERIEQSLYAGESVREAFDIGPGRVVLTSHRVFTFSPGETGVESADLANVNGVGRAVRGSKSGLVWGIGLGAVGIAFLAMGVIAGLSSWFTTPDFDTDVAGRFGSDSLVDVLEATLWLVENIDLVMAVSGIVVLAVTGALLAYYWFVEREESLTIRLAGDQPDIHLPLEQIPVEDELRLEKALAPEQAPDAADDVAGGTAAAGATAAGATAAAASAATDSDSQYTAGVVDDDKPDGTVGTDDGSDTVFGTDDATDNQSDTVFGTDDDTTDDQSDTMFSGDDDATGDESESILGGDNDATGDESESILGGDDDATDDESESILGGDDDGTTDDGETEAGDEDAAGDDDVPFEWVGSTDDEGSEDTSGGPDA